MQCYLTDKYFFYTDHDFMNKIYQFLTILFLFSVLILFHLDFIYLLKIFKFLQYTNFI